MHSPGQIVEFKDRQDVIRALRLPTQCIAAEDGHFTDALRYWQSLSRGGLIPEPRAVDPTMLKSHLGWIHKVDTGDPDPNNYFFRLWGSNVTLERFEAFKGLRISEYPSSPYRESVLQDYYDVVTSGVPSYQQVLASVKYRAYAYGRLILPLATSGRRVDQLLVFIHERPAKTLSDRVTAGTWVTSHLRDVTPRPSDSASGDLTHRFTIIDGGKAH